jgi:hypothetical protein
MYIYIRLILIKTKNTTKRPLSHLKKNGSKCHQMYFLYKTRYKANQLIISAVNIEISLKLSLKYSFFLIFIKKKDVQVSFKQTIFILSSRNKTIK